MTRSIHPDWVCRQREARYEVAMPQGTLIFSVGLVCNEMARSLHKSSATTAAFMLTENAHGEPDDPSGCAEVQGILINDVEALGLTALLGKRSDDAGQLTPKPGVLVFGIALAQAEELARRHGLNGFIWIGDQVGLPALKLMYPLFVPEDVELARWRASLQGDEATAAALLPRREQAALMAVPKSQWRHWLLPALWDISQPWPLARPDGGAMGIGCELDRMFKLVAAGLTPAFSGFSD